jgi:hypothetical protein
MHNSKTRQTHTHTMQANSKFVVSGGTQKGGLRSTVCAGQPTHARVFNSGWP